MSDLSPIADGQNADSQPLATDIASPTLCDLDPPLPQLCQFLVHLDLSLPREGGDDPRVGGVGVGGLEGFEEEGGEGREGQEGREKGEDQRAVKGRRMP